MLFRRLARTREPEKKAGRLRNPGNLLIRGQIAGIRVRDLRSLGQTASRILQGYGKAWYKQYGPKGLQRVLWRARPEAKGSETSRTAFQVVNTRPSVAGPPRSEGV